jgi:hypothetical protein
MCDTQMSFNMLLILVSMMIHAWCKHISWSCGVPLDEYTTERV